MKDAERKVISRKKWLKVYLELGSVTKAALRCGVARSTLHRIRPMVHVYEQYDVFSFAVLAKKKKESRCLL